MTRKSIKTAVNRSSLGTRTATAARRSVPSATSAQVVARAAVQATPPARRNAK
jgi:hypothetical protein